MTLGQKIKKSRLERGMTQKQVVGDYITRNMLSKIENDSATPSVRTLEYLAAALALPVSYFLSETEVSDGTSPDGLDEMRAAFREARFDCCLELLDDSPSSSTTDEGYVLRASAGAGAAREALLAGDYLTARELAETASYYNKEGMYYSRELAEELALISAECSLRTGGEAFEEHVKAYNSLVAENSRPELCALLLAERFIFHGDIDAASRLIGEIPTGKDGLYSRKLYLEGLVLFKSGRYEEAIEALLKAELGVSSTSHRLAIYAALEHCYREIQDFKRAYEFASKQLSMK